MSNITDDEARERQPSQRTEEFVDGFDVYEDLRISIEFCVRFCSKVASGLTKLSISDLEIEVATINKQGEMPLPQNKT